ncbi:MAG: carbohydrate-binding domain-containing protein [Acutalibacteraceae bacterium]
MTKTAIGNSGTVLTADAAVTAQTADTSLVTLTQTDANTVTVSAVEGAVGVASVELTSSGTTQTVEVPVGYTTFAFAGDTLTVFPGSSSNYEISGVDMADNAYTPAAVTNADGSLTYTNTETYTLCVEVKKSGGTFVFEGESDNMAIAVKKEATSPAVLLLDGLTLTSSFTAPITVKKNSSSTVTITALAGSVNTLTDAVLNNADLYGDTVDGGDGTNAAYAESAVIKGKANANVTLNGTGTLNLVCNTKNAVKVGEYGSLVIEDVVLNITSVKHGISSDNTLEIRSGTINVQSTDDAIRSDPDAVDADAGCAGCIMISGGAITICSGSDGIQAAQDITISGGTFDIQTGSGYNDSTFDKETMSCKGIKASFNTDSTDETDTSESTNTITITGGTFTLNTADDAIHSDGYIVITGGNLTIQTGDDGVHADTSLTLGEEDGDNSDVHITVTTSYEGLEAGNVYIYSGIYKVWGSDDGINAAGDGSSNEGFNPGGRPGGPGGQSPGSQSPGSQSPGSSTTTSDYGIHIYGGKVYVNVSGDGLDANGDLNLYGGKIIVWGQAANGDNEPLDCDGTLTIQGATVFAAGSKMMMTTPSTDSQAYVRSTSLTATEGQTINVQYNGTTVYNIIAEKSINYILYSSPDMTSSSGWAFTVDTSALISDDSDPCDDGHTWDSGTYTTEPTCTGEGAILYTCTVCGKTKTVTAAALGHSYTNGYCTRCGTEDPDAQWFVVTFVTDEHSSVTSYLMQDTSEAYEENAQTAYARNSDSGAKDISGNGQVNFSVTVEDGYILTGVTITEGTENYKNLKVVDESALLYRVTKITGDLTVTVTTATKRIAGDANGDGEVNLKDVVQIQRFLAGGWDVEIDASAADVDGDNAVTLQDVVLLTRYLAGGWDVTLL